MADTARNIRAICHTEFQPLRNIASIPLGTTPARERTDRISAITTVMNTKYLRARMMYFIA